MYTVDPLSKEETKNQKNSNKLLKRRRKLKKQIETDINLQKKTYLTGRWNIQEQRNFINACLLYGSDWKKVNKIN